MNIYETIQTNTKHYICVSILEFICNLIYFFFFGEIKILIKGILVIEPDLLVMLSPKKVAGRKRHEHAIGPLIMTISNLLSGIPCISVVTRNLDAFDTRYIRIAEYQPVRDVAGCETLSE